ncbi:MAG: Adenosine monophosphate-protein transferase SoFic [Syntrophorhabdus sp. PtaB.Bin184]|nr:MAG: Adenosine monophosphate-protein transferase SoFic [Syntrophorhabdus sp. PtaB.Bin184]
MQRGSTGDYVVISTVGDEPVRAFAPRPLPPDPPLVIDDVMRDVLDRALLALGRLDGVTALLPDTRLFLYMYVRKEAVLSSQIEGTQSSLSDLLLYEIKESPGVPLNDVVEVSNYVAALEHGLSRCKEGFPLSNRLIREIHEVLLQEGRGSEKSPGEFRRSQNWIGGTRPGNAVFVPPPPDRVADLMSVLELFLHNKPEKSPLLIKVALAHAQFETIHPFLDGNGRVGRLLVPLLLCLEGVLTEPFFYLSLYFKTYRTRYYDLLNAVRTEGEWEAWVQFFLEGVREMAESAVTTARRLADMVARDRTHIQQFGRLAGSSLQVHQSLQTRPLTTLASLVTETHLTMPTVTKAVQALEDEGIVHEITGRRRGRIYSYREYMDIMSEGTALQ